jgi:glucuronokinase
MEPQSSSARPRVGLIGNPSDLYRGKVVAFTFDAFETEVRVEPMTAGVELGSGAGALRFEDWGQLVAHLEPRRGSNGADLLGAALQQLLGHAPQLNRLAVGDPRGAFRVSFTTDVPRQAGLSGSSAIVIAALRAWSRWFGLQCSPFELSELALAAETEGLGLVAGPQDRVVQAYGGLLAMDFREARDAGSYERLDPTLLPDLLIAWDDRVGENSSAVHHDVRERWQAGDGHVREVMARFPALVERGLAVLERGDQAALADVIDANFDARAEVFPISSQDRRAIDLGRALDAGTKFCGSGGAVLVLPRDPDSMTAIEQAYREAGYRTLRPRVGTFEAGAGRLPELE